jgi:hypothetical protein
MPRKQKKLSRELEIDDKSLDDPNVMTSGPATVSAEDVFKVDEQCPEGVPQEVWDAFLSRQNEYLEDWKQGVAKHVRDYDRAAMGKGALKKATAKPTKRKAR